jgi:putative phosphoesterase
MRIGLISDTHDNLAMAERAASLLRGAGVEHVLHAGDVGSERILELFIGIPAHFVWGNTDFIDRESIRRAVEPFGIVCGDRYVEVELAGKRFALTHGDDDRRVKQVLQQQAVDYLITGHTHVADDQREGRIRWINPGAVHRASVPSVAVLELPADALQSLAIPRGGRWGG